jgi:ATP-dependent DNA ligase
MASKTVEFPILYAVASTGKQKCWSIKINELSNGHVELIVSHGYVNHTITTNTRIITCGKNIGKKNETTAFQQAESEAKSLWNKKIDTGYKEESDNSTESSDCKIPSTTISSPPLPMLAHDFNKRGKDIVFPCYAQRKLDGVRCVAIPNNGLYSRNSKQFPGLEHIKNEINKLPNNILLDGELYSDVLGFQEIVGLVKKVKLSAEDIEKQKHIYLFVYDIIQEDKTYTERNKLLETIFKKNNFIYIHNLHTDICENITHVEELHAKYTEEGYEGLILRNKDGLYKTNFRSKDLQKYKHFQDDDYKIVDFQEGDGLEKGCVIWHCITPEGITFKCRPRGTHEDRKRMFLSAKNYVGKKLTVRFQELSDDKVPRFPVGICIRDYE